MRFFLEMSNLLAAAKTISKGTAKHSKLRTTNDTSWFAKARKTGQFNRFDGMEDIVIACAINSMSAVHYHNGELKWLAENPSLAAQSPYQ